MSFFLDRSGRGRRRSTLLSFRVAASLCFKARLSAKPLIRKRFFYSHANKPHFHNKRFARNSFCNVTEPHSASLSNYANDRATSKKVLKFSVLGLGAN